MRYKLKVTAQNGTVCWINSQKALGSYLTDNESLAHRFNGGPSNLAVSSQEQRKWQNTLDKIVLGRFTVTRERG